MADREWPPPEINLTTPNVARLYDYQLGGKDNFAADRELAKQILQIAPYAPTVARDNRGFLRRAVRYMVTEAGIHQFLDIGSGLPTQGNVHEIAQEADPRTRVVYVDNDPVVLVHARALLNDTDVTEVVASDLRRPEEILGNPAVQNFIDFEKPVALLLLAILHHVDDDEAPGIAARLRDALAPDSHMAITHFRNPGPARPLGAEMALAGERLFNEKFGTGRWRTDKEILAFFGDFEVLEPGLVPTPTWRQSAAEERSLTETDHSFVGAVARKPG